MKKKRLILFSLALSFLLIGGLFTGCSSSQTSKTTVKVRLNEVTRSIFYAPMYAAMSEGFFKEEGIEIDLTTGQGADKTMQQVLSGSADIGFCGPEQVIYIYNQKRDDQPILFGQLTQRDGSFFVSRKDEKGFSWESLKGKTILGGRPGGVPEMALEYVLRNHGLIPEQNIDIITNVAFAAAPGAFKGGTGEYAALFEPSASMLKLDNSGFIVASVGKEAGVIPYTCFFAAKSYMDKNPDVIDHFTRAIYKGQLWVSKNSDETVAKSIKSYFPGTDEKLITEVVKNYRDIEAFASTPVLKEQDMNKLLDIIQSYDSKLITERPPFSKIVNNSFAEKVIKDIQK